MTVKQELTEMVAQLPDDCTLEEAEYRFYLLCKLLEGVEAIERGDVIAQEDVERIVAQWSEK